MKKILSFLVVLVLMAAPAIAHPGGVDGKGGHTDRSTGVYHYHHGYGAHQHEDGICPYDFDDKTGEGSGNSNTTRSEIMRSARDLDHKTTIHEDMPDEPDYEIWEWILVGAIAVFLIVLIMLAKREKRMAEEMEKKQLIENYVRSQQQFEEMLKAHERSTTETQEQSEKRVNYR